nr:hypothetical protein [Tanacetum cinerariifolium]
MRRVGKGFSGVETPLFASMLVLPQPQAVEEDEVKVPTAPASPSPTTAPSPATLCYTSCFTTTRTTKFTQCIGDSKAEEEGKEVRKERRSKHSGFKRLRKVGISQRVESFIDTVVGAQEDASKQGGKIEAIDAEPQGMIDQEEVNATKDVSPLEPTVFDDEEVTMTMAQTLIKMKAEKLKLFDEQIAQRLNDEEVEKAAANLSQEKYDNKNMARYKMEHFRGMTYDKVRPIIKREYKKVQTLFKPDKDVEKPKKKRVAEETLLQESFKKLKAVEVLVSEFKVEALQVKYPIIDWEIHYEGSRTYWKIIRVGGITEAYQSFEDMLKGFDKEDLAALWNLVKEKFSSVELSVDKEKALWVELKRLFEPNVDDVLWKLQRDLKDIDLRFIEFIASASSLDCNSITIQSDNLI